MSKHEQRGKSDSQGRETRASTPGADGGPTTVDGRATVTGPTRGAGIAPDGAYARLAPETFSEERDDVLAVINELEDQLDRYEAIRESLERELTGVSEECQAAKQRVQELEWQIITLQTRIDAHEQTQQEAQLLETELAEANTRCQRANERIATLEDENARVTAELRTCNKSLEELWSIRKERDGLRADAKTIKSRLEQFDRAQRELLEERNTLQARVGELSAALEEARSGKHALEMSVRANEDTIGELKRTQEGLEQKLDTLRTEKKSLHGQVTHLERENARLIEQQQFYERELASLRAINRNADVALTNVKKAFAEVRVALAETKSRARRRSLDAWPRLTPGVDPTLTRIHTATATRTQTCPTDAATTDNGLAAVLADETT